MYKPADSVPVAVRSGIADCSAKKTRERRRSSRTGAHLATRAWVGDVHVAGPRSEFKNRTERRRASPKQAAAAAARRARRERQRRERGREPERGCAHMSEMACGALLLLDLVLAPGRGRRRARPRNERAEEHLILCFERRPICRVGETDRTCGRPQTRKNDRD